MRPIFRQVFKQVRSILTKSLKLDMVSMGVPDSSPITLVMRERGKRARIRTWPIDPEKLPKAMGEVEFKFEPPFMMLKNRRYILEFRSKKGMQ